MATLSDLRRMASEGKFGEKVVVAPPDVSYSHNKFKVSKDGTDALLKFGKHHGKTLKALAKVDPSYLDWIVASDFPHQLVDVARSVIQANKAHK